MIIIIIIRWKRWIFVVVVFLTTNNNNNQTNWQPKHMSLLFYHSVCFLENLNWKNQKKDWILVNIESIDPKEMSSFRIKSVSVFLCVFDLFIINISVENICSAFPRLFVCFSMTKMLLLLIMTCSIPTLLYNLISDNHRWWWSSSWDKSKFCATLFFFF